MLLLSPSLYDMDNFYGVWIYVSHFYCSWSRGGLLSQDDLFDGNS